MSTRTWSIGSLSGFHATFVSASRIPDASVIVTASLKLFAPLNTTGPPTVMVSVLPAFDTANVASVAAEGTGASSVNVTNVLKPSYSVIDDVAVTPDAKLRTI